jgi:aldehyde dehydrogenase (NAD+)
MSGSDDATALADQETRLYIEGEFFEASNGGSFPDINPATERAVAEVADGSPEDMQRAIAAARSAFDQSRWADDRDFRKTCLMQLHAGLERNKEHLRSILIAEAGAPLALTHGPQLQTPIDDLLYDIGQIDSFEWERSVPNRDRTPGSRVVMHEPIGVVGAITPWNFPLSLTLWKIGPALAAGNTVVLKPAPDTPLTATAIAKIVDAETDIPAGVFNVVPSADKAAVGEILTSDPRVDMISFTGSVPVGRQVLASAASTIKRVVLELGGKSANIICEDADLTAVMPIIAMMTCYHAGQGCVLTMRTLVPRTRYDEAVETLGAALAQTPYGDPNEMGPLMGPLASRAQFDRVLGYIQSGIDEGARVVTGGSRSPRFESGYYVEPTLFADVDVNMRIAQEEIFGPVQALIPVDDVEEAIRISNESQFGLGGAVYSGSDEQAFKVARRLRVGTVTVNGVGGGGPDVPFGGYRQSGLGREHGAEGFAEFLETKTLGRPAGA